MPSLPVLTWAISSLTRILPLMMVHSFLNYLYSILYILKRPLVLLQPADEYASPTQFFPLHKLLLLPSLQQDILLPAHILVAHLSWILLLHQNPQVENPQENLVQLKKLIGKIFFKIWFLFYASYLGEAHKNTVRQGRIMWHVFKRTYVLFSALPKNLLIRMKLADL